MDNNLLFGSNPSILLWLAAAVVAVLGLRAFLEYLRQVRQLGPVTGWRDLVFASAALQSCVWSSIIIGISAQGLVYPVGYSVLILLGTLLAGLVVCAAALFWVGLRPGWLSLSTGSLALALTAVATQLGVIRAVGAEPGIEWRPEMLVFAFLVLVAGLGVTMRIVLSATRGSKEDRAGRRLLAALLGGVALIGSQELTLLAANLGAQSVSAYTRQLPEVAVALLAGAAMPVVFVVMIVDQHMQRRIRRASRRGRQRIGHLSDDAGPTTQASGLPPPTR